MATFFDLPLEVRDMIYEYYIFAVMDSARNLKTCFKYDNDEARLLKGDPSRMAMEAFLVSQTLLPPAEHEALTRSRRRRGC